MQERLDQDEKLDRKKYTDFTDLEMMQWFLHRNHHIREEDGKSKRTLQEYERELTLFMEQLLHHAAEIHLDIEHVIEGSLFKSLKERHIRRYHEWLANRSPM